MVEGGEVEPVDVLVIANQALTSEVLQEALIDRISAGRSRLHVLVPAVPLRYQHQALVASEHLAYADEDPGFSLARWRLNRTLEQLRAQVAVTEPRVSGDGDEPGAASVAVDEPKITGEVGDPMPVRALEQTLQRLWPQEILVGILGGTQPGGPTDALLRRLRRGYVIPVEVLAIPEPSVWRRGVVRRRM